MVTIPPMKNWSFGGMVQMALFYTHYWVYMWPTFNKMRQSNTSWQPDSQVFGCWLATLEFYPHYTTISWGYWGFTNGFWGYHVFSKVESFGDPGSGRLGRFAPAHPTTSPGPKMSKRHIFCQAAQLQPLSEKDKQWIGSTGKNYRKHPNIP